MTLRTNSFNGGTNGTVITPANSGGASGDALYFVSGSPTYSSAQAAHGTLSCLLTPGSTTTLRYQLSGTETKLSIRWYHFITTQPSGDDWMLRLTAADGSTTLLTIMLKSTGALALDRVGTRLFTGSAAVPTGSWVRYELEFDFAANTIAGGYFAADSTTAIQSISVASAGLAAAPGLLQWYGGDASTGASYIDELAVDDASNTPIGPVAAAVDPPVPVADDRAVYLIDYTGSTPGAGGGLTFSIDQTGGTTTAADLIKAGLWEVVQSATEDLVYEVTVTEAAGGTATDFATVPMVTTLNKSAPLAWTGTEWV